MQTMYDVQKLVERLPDTALMQEVNKPSGTIPMPMVISELNKRKQMRIANQGQMAAQPQPAIGMQSGGPVPYGKGPGKPPIPNDLTKLSVEELKTLLGRKDLPPGLGEKIMKRLSDLSEHDRFAPPSKRLGDKDPTPEKGLWDKFKDWMDSDTYQPKDWRDGMRVYEADKKSSKAKDDVAQNSGIPAPPGKKKAATNKPAVSNGIKSPGSAPSAALKYPEFQNPNSALEAYLQQGKSYSNPYDALITEQQRRADDGGKWGEPLMAAAAAMLSTRGGGLAAGLGNAMNAALPQLQQQRRDQREEQRLLDQMKVQQAERNQANSDAKWGQGLDLARTQADTTAKKNQWGLGALDYSLKEREQAMKEGYYNSEIGKNNAYASSLASGKGGDTGITKAYAAAWQKAYQSAFELNGGDAKAAAQSANEAMAANPVWGMMGGGMDDSTQYDMDADADLFQ